MTLGTGMAIAFIWLFPTACAVTRYVNGIGFCISIVTALIATWILR